MPAEEIVLVTGFPSLLAETVCAEILQSRTGSQVRALGRASALQEARAARDALPDTQRERLAFVDGDASSIDFGLSGLEYKALAREVTHVHHCAQSTHLGIDRRTAERINVRGALEAIEFARTCANLRCLVFHSTAYVSGNRTGTVLEEDLDAGQRFRNVVEETKARAEKAMRKAMGSLPIAVVRPAMIFGDSRTGAIDRSDGAYLLILLVVTSPADMVLPLPRRGDLPLNVVPIDWVARAAVALGRDREAAGGTFHLVERDPFTVRSLCEQIARIAGRPGPRGSLPESLARTLLRAPGLERLTKTPRALLDALTTAVRHDARHAEARLCAAGVAPCPSVDSYVDKIVTTVRQRARRGRGPAVPPAEEADAPVDASAATSSDADASSDDASMEIDRNVV